MKKYCKCAGDYLNKLYSWKIFKLMRNTLLLVFITVLQAYANDTYSQNTKLTLNLNNVTVANVLEEIQNNSEFYFLFNAKLVNVEREVSISMEDKKISEILTSLFSGTKVNYIVYDRQIILTPSDVTALSAAMQQLKITGTVTDEKGNPLPGVTVKVKTTTIGTLSDASGKYTIDNAPQNATLIFSFIGMATQEIPSEGRNLIDVVLKEEAIGLEEVVVIGYGTVKKADLTGAVSVIKPEGFKNMAVLSVGDAMKGQASGVYVRSSGAIGREPRVEIRGIGNLTNNNPLYVIDGLPTSGNRDFNVNDIESIQVLKDASVAAIYGSRAANGVIIITTKKGIGGPMKIDFASKVGMETLPMLDLMGRDEWIKVTDMAYDNAIAQGVPGVTARMNHMSGNTDWQKEAFRTALLQDYNLGFSGGSETGNYLVSMNYLGNSGTAVGTSMERYNFRVNTEGRRGKFTIGENLAVSNTFVEEMNAVFTKHTDVFRMLPTIPVYDPANPGGFGYGNELTARSFASNPIATEELMQTTNENMRIRGNLYAEFQILKSLKYRLNVGLETSNDNNKYLRKVGNFTLNLPYDPSARYENKARYVSTLIEHTLNFNKKLGKHRIDAVVGTTYQKETYERISAEKKDLVKVGDLYYQVIDAGTTNPSAGGYKNIGALISYLGRVNYDYDGKYLFSATLRRDGSSRFSKANRWDNFPSVSLGWRLSKEPFFNVPWISDLKLRANYGTLGSANIGYWDYVASLNSFPIAVFGTNQHLETGMTQIKLVNEDIRWEKKIQKNVGMDVAFIQNKLQVTAEYFISTSKDVLTPLPILMSTGNDGGNPYVNAASLQNKGIELTASWRETKGDFKYSISGNYTRLRNKVLEFGYGKTVHYTWITKTEIGQPLAMFYVIKTDGIFQSDAEVLAHKNSAGVVIQPNAKPGDIRYVDFNDDGKISTAGDRQIAGNPWPKFEMGINFDASYKNFDASIFGFGSFGQDVFNGMRSWVDGFADNTNHLRGTTNPWTPTNTNTDFPRVIYADNRNARGDQDRWLEKGSFFKIRQMSIGYTINPERFNKIFNNLRIAVTGQNLITLTKYTGLDPDFIEQSLFERGHDNSSYPTPKTLIFSLNVNF